LRRLFVFEVLDIHQYKVLQAHKKTSIYFTAGGAALSLLSFLCLAGTVMSALH
jgi:hypothetical protein